MPVNGSPQKLRIEDKGLSQSQVCIELTPNEYAQMQKHFYSYRICVVTLALSLKPVLHVFSFSPENGVWEDGAGKQLAINEIVSARLQIVLKLKF